MARGGVTAGRGGERAAALAPSGPSLAGALRVAAVDFFYNSWRIVPLNVLWGVGFLLALGAAVFVQPLAGLPLLVLTAIPLAGLAHLAGRVARGVGVDFSDAWRPIRERPVAVLVAGAAFVVAITILTLNLIAGFALGNALGWAFATAAGWGLVSAVSVGFAFWPLLTDPERETAGAVALAKLAGMLVLAHPFRIAALAFILGVLLVVSAIALAALVSVSVGYAMLAATRYVLPAADRLEARLVELGRMAPLRVPTPPLDD